jgi:hypothetical protein
MPKGAQSEPSRRDYPYARPSVLAISSSTGRASNSVSAAFDSVSEYRPSLATSGERRQLAQWCFLFRLFRHILSGRSSARSREMCGSLCSTGVAGATQCLGTRESSRLIDRAGAPGRNLSSDKDHHRDTTLKCTRKYYEHRDHVKESRPADGLQPLRGIVMRTLSLSAIRPLSSQIEHGEPSCCPDPRHMEQG